jgi:hypothetical protein
MAKDEEIKGRTQTKAAEEGAERRWEMGRDVQKNARIKPVDVCTRSGRVDEAALSRCVAIGVKLGRANFADASVTCFVTAPIHSAFYTLQNWGPADASRYASTV